MHCVGGCLSPEDYGKDETSCKGTHHLKIHQKVHVPGIFDLKWSPAVTTSRLLGAALADGSLRCYGMEEDYKKEDKSLDRGMDVSTSLATLAEAATCPCFPNSGGMSLSLDWQER